MRAIKLIFISSTILIAFGPASNVYSLSQCAGKSAGECIVIQSAPQALAETPPPTYTSYLSDLYNFLLASVGILSLGALVYGGVLYISAAANPSKTSEAKRWMWNAIYGILLAAFSFVILYTINPDLTKGFTLPPLSSYLSP